MDTTPDTLRADFKDQFRTAISAAYSATGNLDRARARLALVGDPDPVRALSAQAQRMLAAGESFQTAQQLAGLAGDLRAGSVSVPPSATTAPPIALRTGGIAPTAPSLAQGELTPQAAPPTPQATATAPPQDTPTPRPTRTPVPTPGAPFKLVSQDQVCNANLTEGLMQITVLDNHGHPMPGVDLTITWSAGEEHFFTGLKPEIGNGYADFVMDPRTAYSLVVARSGAPVSGLNAPICHDPGGQTYVGSLKLTFQQP
jgi:hypothetical protein